MCIIHELLRVYWLRDFRDRDSWPISTRLCRSGRSRKSDGVIEKKPQSSLAAGGGRFTTVLCLLRFSGYSLLFIFEALGGARGRGESLCLCRQEVAFAKGSLFFLFFARNFTLSPLFSLSLSPPLSIALSFSKAQRHLNIMR